MVYFCASIITQEKQLLPIERLRVFERGVGEGTGGGRKLGGGGVRGGHGSAQLINFL